MWCRRRRRGGSRSARDTRREHRTAREFFDLRDRVVERARREARDHLRPLRGPHVVHAEHATAQVVLCVPGADERQLVPRVETPQQIGLLKCEAQKGTLNALHDRYGAVVRGDVVVAAHDLAADGQPSQHDQYQQDRSDQHAASRPGFARRLLRWRHNAFGLVSARVERRSATGRGVGRRDLIVVAGDPLDDVTILQNPDRIALVLKGGEVAANRMLNAGAR